MFKSMFHQFYSHIRVWIKGIPYLLNEPNIHSFSNLSLNKISLNTFGKDFKHLPLPALKISITTPESLLVFPIVIY